MEVTFKKIMLIFLSIFFLGIEISILYKDTIEVSNGWELRCAIVVSLTVIYSIMVWKIMKLKFSSPKFFVLFSLFMFHLSSILVIGFDKSTTYTSHEMLYRYGEYWGFWGTIYSNFFVYFYIIGIILFSKNEIIENIDSIEINKPNESQLNFCRKIGINIFMISILPQLYHDICQISIKISDGYSNMLESEISFYGIPLGWFTKLFLPSILIILSSYRYEKKKFTKIMMLTLIYYSAFMFLTGRKGNTIQTFVPLIFMYCYFFKPKIKIRYVIIAYLGIYLITMVTQSRAIDVNEHFISNLKEIAMETKPIKDLALEMGGTVKAPIQALMSIPSTGEFQWGKTYIYSTIYSILSGLKIPNNLSKNALFNIYLSQTERGEFINSTVFAMGGSAIAEWYWNFGWIGIPLVIIFSYFILKYEKRLIYRANNPLDFAVMTSFMYYLMRYTRGYFNEIIWQPIYIYLFIFIFSNILKKRNIISKNIRQIYGGKIIEKKNRLD